MRVAHGGVRCYSRERMVGRLAFKRRIQALPRVGKKWLVVLQKVKNREVEKESERGEGQR